MTPTHERCFGHSLINTAGEGWLLLIKPVDVQKLITGPHCLISRDCDGQFFLNLHEESREIQSKVEAVNFGYIVNI